MDIVLKTELKVTKILAVTKAKLFEHLKIGSKIRLSAEVTRSFGAIRITVENIDTKESVLKTFVELNNILPCFEFEKIKET